MAYRAIVFDFDLTLADSTAGAIACVNYALEQLGVPPASPQCISASIGLSLPETLAYVTGSRDPELARQFGALFIERADQVMAEHTVLYPPVPQVIRRLQSQGLALGIVSTKLRYRIEAILAREGLRDAFSVIVGGENVDQHKPHPSGLLLALSHLQSTLDEAVYVGDHVVDAQTASRAGVSFVGVLTGHSDAPSLLTHGALAVIPDLSSLPSVLHELYGQTGT